jgi:acetyl-CoA synthetase
MDSVHFFPHLEQFQTYEQALLEFQWVIPERINVATAICRGQADAVTRVALTDVKHAAANTYTFGGLDFLSDKFATALSESGITHRDSVAVILPQSAALAVAHLGALKSGAVVVPLSMSSDPGWLERVLTDCDAKALVIDQSRVETSASLPNPKSCFVVRDLRPANTSSAYRDFWTEVDGATSDFEAVETDANSRAFIFYVESQGTPTGIVHSHRSVIGQLTAFEMFNNLPQADAVFWTSDDWSSSRAVLGVLYPAWSHGCSLVAGASDAVDTMQLLERYEVTHAFIPSSRLKMFAEPEPNLRDRPGLKLRTVISDAPLSPELRDWAEDHLNVTLNEVYGSPETGWIAGGCARWFPARAGAVGRVVPGHSIEILDESGAVLPPGVTGRIAVHRSDPALFSGFHRAHERTSTFFVGDWFLTGDLGYKSEDGYLSVHHPHI